MSQKDLKFAVSALLPMLVHSEQATSQKPALSECRDKTKWLPDAVVIEGFYVGNEHVDQSKLVASLYFVKDDSVYMMSCGTPGQVEDPTGKKHVVEYAQGFNPTENPEWDDDVHAICGGDDFALKIQCKAIRKLLAEKPRATQFFIRPASRPIKFWVG